MLQMLRTKSRRFATASLNRKINLIVTKEKFHVRPPSPSAGEHRVLDHAVIKYPVPANILLAITEKERDKTGMAVANNNGTYDIGTMQFALVLA